MPKLWILLACQMAIDIAYLFVKANTCLGGQDIFAAVRENSPPGELVANLTVAKDPGANSVRLCLTGDNADWFYLEGKSIRLNTSLERVLDREVQGSVLIAALTCYEDDPKQGKIFQSRYRVTVEILNENDNAPEFSKQTVQPFDVSELTAVNSVIATVQARDADNDAVEYAIDTSSADASFFKMALPGSGKVLLAKALDYETKTRLRFVVYAVEANTKEKYSATADITVNVVDADDQYPKFQPCTPLSPNETLGICANPIYRVNITENEQDAILDFSPGPIHAEDGDRGLMTPLVYSILSGADADRFRINPETGEVVLTRRVENRLQTPSLKLSIMASQKDDPKKYTVATALVRVLARNRFPPEFDKTAFEGFVTESAGTATLVHTYGDGALVIQAVDRDFKDGINPKLHYTLRPRSNSTRLYHMTQEGLIIARTNQLRAFEKHLLEVLATDQESGEVVNASIHIEVLPKDQPVPQSPFGEGHLRGAEGVDADVAGGLVGVIVLLVAAVLCLILQLVRSERRPPASTAAQKTANAVNRRGVRPLVDELSYHNEAFIQRGASSPVLQGQHGVYTRKGSTAPPRTTNRDRGPQDAPVAPLVLQPLLGSVSPSITTDGGTATAPVHKSVSFQDEVTPEEEEARLTPGGRSGHARVRPEDDRRDGTARSPREPPSSQSNGAGKAAGGEGSEDKSYVEKQDRDDTLPKWLKEQEAYCGNESIGETDVPENPYKL